MSNNKLFEDLFEPSYRCQLRVGTYVNGSCGHTIEFSVKGDMDDTSELIESLRDLANLLEAPVEDDCEMI